MNLQDIRHLSSQEVVVLEDAVESWNQKLAYREAMKEGK